VLTVSLSRAELERWAAQAYELLGERCVAVNTPRAAAKSRDGGSGLVERILPDLDLEGERAPAPALGVALELRRPDEAASSSR